MVFFYLMIWLLFMSITRMVKATENDCDNLENYPVCLRGGSNAAEGNVFVDGLPVCDDNWGKTNADVVCKQLGYTRGALRATTKSQFGQMGKKFAMDDVQCSGTEDKIKKCPHEKREDCGVQEAAGVVCDFITAKEEVKNQEMIKECFVEGVGYKSKDKMSEVKIVSSAMHCQRWCTESTDCTHFTFNIITKNCLRYSQDSDNGKINEESIVSGPRECLKNKVILENCKTNSNTTICLLNTNNLTHAGNVFVNQSPVCDDNWSIEDAEVICKQFGFHGVRRSTIMSHFGLVPSLFTMDDVECSGTEKNIFNCSYSAMDDCDSSEGAGVICDIRSKIIIEQEKECYIRNMAYSQANKLDVSLKTQYADECQGKCLEYEDCSHFTWFSHDNKCLFFNRDGIDEGKVDHVKAVSGPRICFPNPLLGLDFKENCTDEDAICLVGESSNEGNVFVGGKPVCDDGWNIYNAHVACKQKGFVRALNATSNSKFGNVSQVFGLDNVDCTGKETHLKDCTHSPTEDCEGLEAAGVICDPQDLAEISRNEQILLEKCFSENVVYGTQLSDELIYLPTLTDCQLYCQQDLQCDKFSYNNKTGECNRRTTTGDASISYETKRDGEWTASVWLNNDGSEVLTNIGEKAFNTLFAECPVIRYSRNGAVYAVYVRTSSIPDTFNAFSMFTDTWASKDNRIHIDFMLYSSLINANKGIRAWSYCNYDDGGIGFPRDCGQNGYLAYKWFTMPGGRASRSPGILSGIGFDIYTGPTCPVQISSSSPCEVSRCSSNEGCPLVKNRLLTTLTQLEKEFSISYEFLATEYISGWQNVIHFTEDGNCCDIGERVPGLWVKDSGRIHPSFAVNSNGNYAIVTTKEYPLVQWHHVEVSQALENGEYIHRVKINGVTEIEVENEEPRTFSNIKVYAADPWHNSLNGYLRNLFINIEGPNKCTGTNIEGVVSLSTSHSIHGASNCVDGDLNTYCHSQANEKYPYLLMEYPKSVLVRKVKIVVRKDCCGDRVKQLVVSVTNVSPVPGELASLSGGNTIGRFSGPAHNGQVLTFTSEVGFRGKYVVIQQEYIGTLNLAEINIIAEKDPSTIGKKFQSLSSNIISGPSKCSFPIPIFPSKQCEDSEMVCLSGGSTPFEGNLYFGGKPICDDQWNLRNGQVICKQLGFGLAKEITRSSRFGNVNGPFSITNVECIGNEDHITDCIFNPSPQCLGDEAAGIICESDNERLIREEKERIINECFIGDTCYDHSYIWRKKRSRNEYAYAYDDYDYASESESDNDYKASVKECQEYCEDSDLCTHFTYYKDTGHCFHSSNETKTHCENVISGPKNCDKVRLAIDIPKLDSCNDEDNLCLWSKENGKNTSNGNVFVGGKPICDDSWSLVDAEVVCRQLNFHGVRDITTQSYFGYVSGTFFMDDVACTGAENNITECDHKKTDNCDGGEAAGVVCDTRNAEVIEKEQKIIKDCFMEDIHLRGIYLNSSTNVKSVIDCHDQCKTETECAHFTLNTISHNCTLYKNDELGRKKKTSFGSYSGPKSCDDRIDIVKIDEDEVNCTGTQDLCLKGLKDGLGRHEGNVFWGSNPVCDDHWDFVNANVVCKQKGFFHALASTNQSNFGNVSMIFSLDDISCNGNEDSLEDCQHTTKENCDGSEAAGVICDKRNETEIVAQDHTSVCFAENITTGPVLLIQRGIKQVEYVYLPSALDCQKWCQLNSQCGFFSFKIKSQKCFLRQDIYEKFSEEGFISGPKTCVNKAAKLENIQGNNCYQPDIACVGGGSGPNEGNVYIGGKPVCDEIGSWGLTNAHVFCKQMGYRKAKQFHRNSYFGNVTGPFFATNVHCIGNEGTLGDCRYNSIPNCLKMEAVGVICETFDHWLNEQKYLRQSKTCLEMDTRYSGSDIANQRINGHGEKKNTVADCQAACQEHPECEYFTYFTENHISSSHKNICRMLKVKGESQHGKSNHISGPKQCHTCRKYNDDGTCRKYVEKECTKSGFVCLAGGNKTEEGNVLVGGRPVCDDAWDKQDADVVCRQLGFSEAHKVTNKSYFGRVSSNFGMDDVACNGSEVELKDCKHKSNGHDCSQDEGAGVICLSNIASPSCSIETNHCCHSVHIIQSADTLSTDYKHFRPENVLEDDCDHFNSEVPSKTTYWLAPSRQTGGYMILDLGCSLVVDKIIMKNTHNGKYNDRGLAAFTISVSNSINGPWHVVLTNQLQDVRNQSCSVPLENFSLGDTVKLNRTGQFVKLDVINFYGNGAGLQYLKIEGHKPDSSSTLSTLLGIGFGVAVLVIASVSAAIWLRKNKRICFGSDLSPNKDVISFTNLVSQISTNTEETSA